MTGAVVGLGEVLWDLLPTGPALGGAPANFAVHAAALGAPTALITRIGADERGTQTMQRMVERGFAAELIQVDPVLPTGTVTVSLSGAGVPDYVIHAPAAWDRIEATPEALGAMSTAAALCFGSLAQRAAESRRAIQTLVGAAPPDCWRIFDVNLRQHYYERHVLEESLALANVLKLNDGELVILGDLMNVRGTMRAQMERLTERFNLRAVAVTKGAGGSALFASGCWSERSAYPVELVDTVGAGDAFTAALCVGLMRGIDLDRINDAANRLAAFVCRTPGATPTLPAEWRHGYPGEAGPAL